MFFSPRRFVPLLTYWSDGHFWIFTYIHFCSHTHTYIHAHPITHMCAYISWYLLSRVIGPRYVQLCCVCCAVLYCVVSCRAVLCFPLPCLSSFFLNPFTSGPPLLALGPVVVFLYYLPLHVCYYYHNYY